MPTHQEPSNVVVFELLNVEHVVPEVGGVGRAAHCHCDHVHESCVQVSI